MYNIIYKRFINFHFEFRDCPCIFIDESKEFQAGIALGKNEHLKVSVLRKGIGNVGRAEVISLIISQICIENGI